MVLKSGDLSHEFYASLDILKGFYQHLNFATEPCYFDPVHLAKHGPIWPVPSQKLRVLNGSGPIP